MPADDVSPHILAGFRMVDLTLPLPQLTGPAVVIDIPRDIPGSAPGVSLTITASFITDWEIKNGELAAGDIVLFRSSWDRHYLPGEDGLRYCYRPLVTKDASGWPAPDPTRKLCITSSSVG